MVNVVSLVLMKRGKILLLKRSKNRLPVITIKGEETAEECIERWSEGAIEFKDAKVIKYNKNITIEDYNITLIFMDITNSEVNLIDKNLVFEDCMWAGNLNSFENELFRYVITQCEIENYSSSSIESLKETVKMKGKYKVSNKSLVELEKVVMENNKAIILVILSLIMGILFSRFSFGYLGISVPILTILMIALFIFIVDIRNNSVLGYFFILVSILLSCTYAIFTNWVFRGLNLFVIPISLFSGFLLLTYNNIPFKFISFVGTFLEIIIGKSIENTTKLPLAVKDVLKRDKFKKENNYAKNILTGILISVPLLIFLGILLSGADEVFSYYLRNLWRLLNIENIYDFILKAIIAIIIMFLVFGLFYSLNSTKIKEVGIKNPNKSFNSITIITILISIVILYVTFTKIQVSYLYLNKKLPIGFDFSKYARSGFFQLVALVLINILIITAMNFKTAVNSIKSKNVLNVLYTIITGLTINMGISAIYKMNLYINEFGYTRLRILVQAFTVFLCISLLILLLFIWKSTPLFKPIAIIGLSIYLFLNYFNMDNFIVKQNLKIINAENKIDIYYLTTLSLDAYSGIKEGKENGTIKNEDYIKWINKRIDTKNWHEYNYFNNKIVK